MDLTNASAIVTSGAGGFGSATLRRHEERARGLYPSPLLCFCGR